MAAVCMHSLKRGNSLPYSKYYFLQFLKSLKHATLLLFVYTHNSKGKGLRFTVLYHVSTFYTTLQLTSYPP